MTELSDGASIVAPPSEGELDAISALLAPWRAATRPVFLGLENVPAEGAMLLAGNHTIYGMLDLPLMIEGVYRATGRLPRGLADHAHYAVPGWRDVLTRLGAVRGTRENCRALLAAGEPVLVYPGGGREVAKRKGEAYTLLWKERVGFAKLAIEARCPIVPFAAVGAEDAYDIVLDADSRALRPVRAVAERLGLRTDILYPIARGAGPTLLPRPERFYFSFGRPIEVGASDTPAGLQKQARAAVEALIAQTLEYRESDPDRQLLASVRRRLGT